jgi:prolyl-tRNA synthetase
VLYDDRTEVSAGQKFADSDLIGIPNRVIISSKTMAENGVEIKNRRTSEIEIVPLNQIIQKFSNA